VCVCVNIQTCFMQSAFDKQESRNCN